MFVSYIHLVSEELTEMGQTAWCQDELDKTTGTAIVNALVSLI